MEIKFTFLSVILLAIACNSDAQSVSLNQVVINQMSFTPVNCDFHTKWGEGELLKTWQKEEEGYTIVYEIHDFDSIEVFLENYIETKNSYVDYIKIKTSKFELKAGSITLKVGMLINEVGNYLPSVLDDYINLVKNKPANLQREISVGIPLIIKNPIDSGTYNGKLIFAIQNNRVNYIQLDLRSEGDYD